MPCTLSSFTFFRSNIFEPSCVSKTTSNKLSAPCNRVKKCNVATTSPMKSCEKISLPSTISGSSLTTVHTFSDQASSTTIPNSTFENIGNFSQSQVQPNLNPLTQDSQFSLEHCTDSDNVDFGKITDMPKTGVNDNLTVDVGRITVMGKNNDINNNLEGGNVTSITKNTVTVNGLDSEKITDMRKNIDVSGNFDCGKITVMGKSDDVNSGQIPGLSKSISNNGSQIYDIDKNIHRFRMNEISCIKIKTFAKGEFVDCRDMLPSNFWTVGFEKLALYDDLIAGCHDF